jgi:branched-chain amino acid transport system ATP-binding protein
MTKAILTCHDLNKDFGGIAATEHVDLEVFPNEIHAVIGPNGAGKTTLVSQLSGDLMPDSGQVIFDGRDITRLPPNKRSYLGLARSFQITSVFLEMSVRDNVALAAQAHQGHSFRFWKPAHKDESLTLPAMDTLEHVGLADRWHLTASALSHGERRQLEIAMALATNPKVLLLDEPMAGMGVEESAAMVKILRTLKGHKSMLLIEHDMDAVFALADRITVLVYGRVIATGKPREIRANTAVKHAYLGDAED